MKPRKGRDKVVARFDEEARRDYLTGFQKRKKQRRKKAQLVKLQKAKELLREMKREKQVQVKKKMQQYGLAENDDEQELSSRVVHHYPHQVVVVNTQPELGTTLSSMVNQEEDASKEEKVATNTLSTTKTQCKSRRPSVKDHHYNSKRTARKNKSIRSTA